MNNLKLLLIGLCVFSLVVLFAGCAAFPACVVVVKVQVEVCPTK